MDVQDVTAVSSALYGVAWAGIVMLYDFSMNKNNILNWWYYIIKPNGRRKKRFHKVFLFKILGGCPACFGFWFGLLAILLPVNYFIFLGFSQLILIYRYGS